MDNVQKTAALIANGKAFLGIELGSTRVKAVLTGPGQTVLASGDAWWENQQVNGVWTYGLEDVWASLQTAYLALAQDVHRRYGVQITSLAAMGVSAMMHGYLVFGEDGRLLAPFRTWRNTMTGQAAEKLSAVFGFHIPQRFSIAHLYHSILIKEAHVPLIRYMTTLAGYVHWQLTGQQVLGVGDASGMFPVGGDGQYHHEYLALFEGLVAKEHLPFALPQILPQVLVAGEQAGTLTKEGAMLLDPQGVLQPGIPLCPPEGDAGTGMVATNVVAKRTGNISAGTSIFAMFVLDKPLRRAYDEIDLVTTPEGSPVAMVHCNNGTSDLNAWVDLFAEYNSIVGLKATKEQVYQAFFDSALQGEKDAGGVTSYGYFSGEHITGFEKGCPMMLHPGSSRFTFPNVARSLLMSALSTLALGMKVLDKEQVVIDRVMAHGGMYKTGRTGQVLTAAALNAPVSVMQTAGEGGAWGAAVLAGYLIEGQGRTLPAYLSEVVFAEMPAVTIVPDPADAAGFQQYLGRFTSGLLVQRAAVDTLME